MEDIARLILILLFVVAAGVLYFLPTIIANQREHHQAGVVTVVNIFLGWTLLGWVIALAIAVSEVKKRA